VRQLATAKAHLQEDAAGASEQLASAMSEVHRLKAVLRETGAREAAAAFQVSAGAGWGRLRHGSL
jgi:hypothetical protein